MTYDAFTRHPLLDLFPNYPSTISRECWRCEVCQAFFYPKEDPTECPYCTEKEHDGRQS